MKTEPKTKIVTLVITRDWIEKYAGSDKMEPILEETFLKKLEMDVKSINKVVNDIYIDLHIISFSKDCVTNINVEFAKEFMDPKDIEEFKQEYVDRFEKSFLGVSPNYSSGLIRQAKKKLNKNMNNLLLAVVYIRNVYELEHLFMLSHNMYCISFKTLYHADFYVKSILGDIRTFHIDHITDALKVPSTILNLIFAQYFQLPLIEINKKDKDDEE